MSSSCPLTLSLPSFPSLLTRFSSLPSSRVANSPLLPSETTWESTNSRGTSQHFIGVVSSFFDRINTCRWSDDLERDWLTSLALSHHPLFLPISLIYAPCACVSRHPTCSSSPLLPFCVFPWVAAMLEQLAFTVSVGLFMRCEYLLSQLFLQQKYTDWSANKRRLFAVRVVSLTHATVSAFLVVASLAVNSNYVRDLYDYSSYNARFVFLWSMGYFVYDLFDMIYHGEGANSKEYLVHHTIVIGAFCIIMGTGKLMGFAMVALLVEVQTVLLHSRSLLHLAGYSKTPFFRALVRTNMTCLFLFRHLPISSLIIFLVTVDSKCPLLLKLLLLGGLSFIEYHNIHLTVSMYKTDGIFGGEMKELSEDDVDPLGAVRQSQSDEVSERKCHAE